MPLPAIEGSGLDGMAGPAWEDECRLIGLTTSAGPSPLCVYGGSSSLGFAIFSNGPVYCSRIKSNAYARQSSP